MIRQVGRSLVYNNEYIANINQEAKVIIFFNKYEAELRQQYPGYTIRRV